MVQRTFYALENEAPPDEPEWVQAPDDVHTMRWGYNLADLERLAKISMSRAFGGGTDYLTRYELAWSAMAEHLYACTEAPTPADLLEVGSSAISKHLRAELHHHGMTEKLEPMPRFARWWEQPRPTGPELRTVERVALWQIWEQIGDLDREVLLALAAHDDYQAAATSIGMTYPTYVSRINRARRTFRVFWHEGETPSAFWGTDRRSTGTTSPLEDDAGRRAARAVRKRAGRRVTEPVHGKAGTYTYHRCRCRPCTDAMTEEATARRRAKGIPAKKVVTDDMVQQAAARKAAGEPPADIAADLGIAKSTLDKRLRKLASSETKR